MRENKLTSKLGRRLWNPLLLVNGMNYIGQEQKKKNPEYDQIEKLYKNALKETSTNNLVLGLEIDDSTTDQNCGGFYSAGFVPKFFSPLGLSKNWEKDFNFYWPRDVSSGKFSSYLGSLNLGIWPKIFHDLTSFQIDTWNKGISYYGGRILQGKFSLSDTFENDYWMHFFVGEDSDYETCVPDCHVRMTAHKNPDRMNEWSRNYYLEKEAKEESDVPQEQYLELFNKWQKEKTVETNIHAPAVFFKNLVPRFYWDNNGYTPEKAEKFEDTKGSIWQWGKGKFSAYGKPQSQQDPKRYISPESYYLRGLTPMFAFNDDERDMTYQFYADAFVMDDISHKRAYCKLDGSCT